jgi:glycosyltransferase involved in cell wall biosynthesis
VAEPISVLRLIDSLAPGGAERSLVDLAPHLVAAGIRLEVAVLHDRPGLGAELERSGVPVTVVDGHSRPARVAGMVRLLRRRRPDLVHTTLFESDLVGRTAAALLRVPVVSSLVSTPYGPAHAAEAGVRRSRLLGAQAADAATARTVRRFHAVSEATVEAYVTRLRLRSERFEVIPDGRDLAKLGPSSAERRRTTRHGLGIGPDVPVALAVARQEPPKGLDVLLRAVPAIRSTLPGCLVLVAGGPGRATDELVRLMVDLDVGDSVRFLGHRDDVADLLCAADVFVLPSRREGLPGVILEAMAMGVPVVASDMRPVREAVPDDRYAVLVPPEDPTALAAALTDAVGDRAVAERRAQAARARFTECFEITAVSRAMVGFYEKALRERPRRSLVCSF